MFLEHIFLWTLFMHWIADFVCQSHYMSQNKSKSYPVLAQHVLAYSMVMSGGMVIPFFLHPTPFFPFYTTFFAITFVTHFITDAITSRITSRLYAKGDIHNFFVVIGLDQFIHFATLYVTLYWLLGEL